jgi:multimeric flavodoxin WrbA
LVYIKNDTEGTTMRVIGISGSPRKKGNTQALLQIALKASRIKDTKLVHLIDYRIEPCDGCGVCWKTKKCPIDDDLETVLKELVNSDAILVGSPVYYGAVSPQMKAFIDRSGELLGSRGYPLKDKIGGALAVARRWGGITTWTTLLLWVLEMRLIVPGAGWAVALALHPNDVLKDKEGVERAKELGASVGNLCRKVRKKT